MATRRRRSKSATTHNLSLSEGDSNRGSSKSNSRVEMSFSVVRLSPLLLWLYPFNVLPRGMFAILILLQRRRGPYCFIFISPVFEKRREGEETITALALSFSLRTWDVFVTDGRPPSFCTLSYDYFPSSSSVSRRSLEGVRVRRPRKD